MDTTTLSPTAQPHSFRPRYTHQGLKSQLNTKSSPLQRCRRRTPHTGTLLAHGARARPAAAAASSTWQPAPWPAGQTAGVSCRQRSGGNVRGVLGGVRHAPGQPRTKPCPGTCMGPHGPTCMLQPNSSSAARTHPRQRASVWNTAHRSSCARLSAAAGAPRCMPPRGGGLRVGATMPWLLPCATLVVQPPRSQTLHHVAWQPAAGAQAVEPAHGCRRRCGLRVGTFCRGQGRRGRGTIR